MFALSRRNLGLAAGMIATAALTAGALIAYTAHAEDTLPKVGAPAPDFTAADINGKTVKLSDFADKTVVLEWNNPECPFVMRHYQTVGDLPKLQAEATGQGVVWLTVNSSAEGQQGYRDEAGYKAYLTQTKASPSHAILDHSGKLGHLYAAKATPNMYVIDKGKLVYEGAIDDRATASPSVGVDGAHNYVRAALDAIAKGQPVAKPQTVAYGCSVKYSS
jgi:hypothetical protein